MKGEMLYEHASNTSCFESNAKIKVDFCKICKRLGLHFLQIPAILQNPAMKFLLKII